MDWVIIALIIAIVVATAVFIYLQPRDLPQTLNMLSQQVRQLEAEAAASRGELRQMESRIYEAVRLIDKLSHGVQELTAQIVQDGGIPVWELPTDAKLLLQQPPTKQKKRTPEHRLAQNFGEYFDEAELRGIALQMGAEFENLPGSIRQVKAQSLVRWAANRELLPDLVEIGQQERPLLDWSL